MCKIWRMVLSALHSQAIRKITLDPNGLAAGFSALPREDPCACPIEQRDQAAAVVRAALSPGDATTLAHFAAGLEPWLVVRTGLDLSTLPETPTDFPPIADTSWWPLAWLTVGIMASAGARLVSYACENAGAAFVNLVARSAEQVGEGLAERSTKAMRGHTDGASFPFPSEYATGREHHSPAPDLLVLVGLRNERKIPTRLAPVSVVLEALSDEEVEALAGPWFDIKSQPTFDTDEVRVGAPILSRGEPRHGLSIRFSHSHITTSEGAPPTAGTALRKLVEALPGLSEDVMIGPGDVCLVHNRQVIHGRREPGSGFGGTTRWLLRTYGWMDATNGNPKPGGPAHIHL